MPLDELFEWYGYHCEQHDIQSGPVEQPKAAVVARSVDEEIAMMRATMGAG